MEFYRQEHRSRFPASPYRASQVSLMIKKKKKPARQCKRHKRLRFDHWIGKIPWRRIWQPTLVKRLSTHALHPVNCSPIGFSVHGIFQARILEQVAIPTPGPRDWTHISCVSRIDRRILYHSATRESHSLRQIGNLIGCVLWALTPQAQSPLESAACETEVSPVQACCKGQAVPGTFSPEVSQF